MNVLPKLDRDSIKKLARQLSPAYLLYYPGHKWLVEQFAGTVFFFKPDLGGKEIPHMVEKNEDGSPKMVKADGVMEVRDRYGVLYEPIATAKWGYSRPIKDLDGKIEEETADKVITYFTTKFGENAATPEMAIGLTMLTGDDVVDAEIKKVSKRLFLKSQLAWAEKERSTRQEDIAKWKRNHPGQTEGLPPMNARQIEAETLLLQGETLASGSQYAFICQFGDFETDDEALFNKHFAIRHPQAEEAADAEVAESAVSRPKRGRPRKTVDAATLT